MRLLPQLDAEERHTALWATATVFLVLLAHAILETARDALFLSHLPAGQLPWVYLSLAILALVCTRLLGRSAGPARDLRQLIVVQLVAALGTAAFLAVTDSKPAWVLYALYIWGGLASTLILLRFWLLLSGSFTSTQARRVFPLIAAGPLLGSLAGYGIAGVVTGFLPPADLLGISAAAFLLSAGGSFVLWRAELKHEDESVPEEEEARREYEGSRTEEAVQEGVASVLRHPYVRRVASLLLLASITSTITDFIFKSVVARSIAPAQLGSFFATTYFSFDLLAVALLFAAVVPFVRARPVSEALAVQPALMIVGAAMLTVSVGLPAVLLLRGVDGVLKWSLHKTVTELLYVPMSTRLRNAVKGVSDVVAHRGGQAAGSLLILAWLAASPSERMMGPVIIACGALWVYLALSMQQPYLELFRTTLSEESIDTRIDFPELDIGSLETLITALSSPDQAKVLAAMYLLEQTDRVRLIPALILYHPSPAVVVRALALFADSGREDFLPLSDHLLQHPDAAVRAAMVRASAAQRPDIERLKQASESESASVAVTAVVALAAHGGMTAAEAEARLEPFLVDESEGGDEIRYFIARALRDHPSAGLSPVLTRLAVAPDAATRREAVRALGAAHDESHLPVLVNLLPPRDTREAVRQALLGFGQTAFAYLENALADLSLPRSVRLHLPRTISRFATQKAADVLLRHLSVERSGTVRFKILRGMGRLVADHPQIMLEPTLVDAVIDAQLTGSLKLLHWRVLLQGAVQERPDRRTPGFDLLVDLLQQKELFALERLFRALHLKYPTEDLDRVYDGLRSADPAARSSSRELLHHLLPAHLRNAVVGLVEELPDEERLKAGHAFHAADDLDFEALLTALVGDSSDTLSCIASYYIGELGMMDLRAPMEARPIDERQGLAALRQRSLEMLRPAVRQGGAG